MGRSFKAELEVTGHYGQVHINIRSEIGKCILLTIAAFVLGFLSQPYHIQISHIPLFRSPLHPSSPKRPPHLTHTPPCHPLPLICSPLSTITTDSQPFHLLFQTILPATDSIPNILIQLAPSIQNPAGLRWPVPFVLPTPDQGTDDVGEINGDGGGD